MAGMRLDNGPGGPLKTKLMADINITPMVDVMLVLLVIFMVTAPLLVAGVRVDLPRNAAPKLSQLKKPVIVTLAADGTIYAGDELLDRDRLEAQLSALRAKEGDATVYLRADRKASYGEVLELLGRIGQAGYRRISLLSQPLDASSRSSGAAEPASIAGSGRP
jgi:biopolymer transport protein TolR